MKASRPQSMPYTEEVRKRAVALYASSGLSADQVGKIVGVSRSSVGLWVNQAGITKAHVFPYSPRPGTRTAADDRVPRAVKRERSERLRALSREQTLRRWREKIGEPDVVLVDRPGRGYGDDYSPWFVDAPVGELVAVRGAAVTEEGILAA